MEHALSTDVLTHERNGGRYYPGWRAAGIAITGALLLLGIIFGIAYLLKTPE